MLIPRLLGGADADPAQAAVDALRMLASAQWPGTDPALLLTVGASRSNPVTALLSGALPPAGICRVDVRDLATARVVAERVSAATAGRTRIGIHLNWLHRLVEATTAAGAGRAAAAVDTDLTALRAAGVRVLWTVHNVFPHDAPFPDVQRRLRTTVAAAADLVHVFDPRTPEIAAPYFSVDPALVRHVPHPGWQGVYPDWMSGADARSRLGLPADAIVFLLFGRLTADKELPELVAAFEEAAAGPAAACWRLLLAGAPPRDPDPETAAALARAARHPRIDLWPAPVPADQVQLALRAADLAVTPHRHPLNSGVQALALTFGLPLVTAVGAGPPLPSAYAASFPAGDVPALRQALADGAAHLRGPGPRDAALAAAAAVHPAVVAPAFGTVVRELLGLT